MLTDSTHGGQCSVKAFCQNIGRLSKNFPLNFCAKREVSCVRLHCNETTLSL